LQYNITYRERYGKIQYIISYKDHNGKWRQKSEQGFVKKGEAKEAADKMLDKLKESFSLRLMPLLLSDRAYCLSVSKAGAMSLLKNAAQLIVSSLPLNGALFN